MQPDIRTSEGAVSRCAPRELRARASDIRHPTSDIRTPSLEPDGRSTVLHNTDPQIRADLDRAIVRREPPTFRALYAHFRLAERRITFASFYRYASRLRRRLNADRLSRRTVETEEAPQSPFHHFLAPRFHAALVDPATRPEALHCLARIYRAFANDPAQGAHHATHDHRPEPSNHEP